MQTIKTVLVVLLFASMFVTLVCGVLTLTVGRPPDALGLVSAGTAMMSVGLLTLGEAFSKSGWQARWRGTGVTVGRLSSFAFGIGGCALGVVFLGYGLLPERHLFWVGGAFTASFPFALVGQKIDGLASKRAARRESV
jgi:hypothetical protein